MRIILTFFCALSVWATELPPYQVVENRATLPLLNPTLSEQIIEKLRLANGLEIYLVSDPQVTQSAAGLAVEAGSWQDPKEYPGLAHFLEHMLFMGTKAYPKEFEYMQFITDHGGSVNAYTGSDRTVYMFSINNDAFEPALNRFSHFFIDPLFLPNCINRELHAVDQEHSKNIEHDGWRQYMILKETGNPNHPNRSFSTGNAATLSGIPQEALKKWYHTYYGANRMHLVMISPLPIDQMRMLAVRDFSAVQSVPTPSPITELDMLSSQQKGHFIYIKPIRDIKQLSIVWEAPKAIANDLTRKIPELVAYVLRQEGPNSLSQQLKAENLADGVQVTADRFSKDTLLFSIDVSLTDQGIRQIQAVIDRIYQTLARLKTEGISLSLFNEMQTLAKLNYQYQARDDAFSTVIQLADALVYEELGSFPENTAIPSVYDPTAARQFLQSLDARSAVYFVLADPQKTGVTPTVKEQWMDAEYAFKAIEDKQLMAWNRISVHKNILMPESNPFVPTSLNRITLAEVSPPRLIYSDEGAEVYFSEDTQYLLPELSAIFSFKSPAIDNSATSQVLIDIYLKSLREQLSSTLFFARKAHLQTRFGADDRSVRIAIHGFSDKAPLLIETLFQHLRHVKPSQEQFLTYVESLSADYDNASKELPVQQAHAILDNVIFDQATDGEKLDAIRALSYDTFLQFSKDLFSKTYTEAFFYGNLSQRDATELFNNLRTTLAADPYPRLSQPKKQVLLLPNHLGPHMLVQQTPLQGHGLVLLIEEGSYTFEKRAAQQVLGTALRDAFFDTLRTKQQTAYIAKATAVEKERQLLQYFSVQSSTHHPSELLARFELFIEDFNKNLHQMISQERFDNIKNNIVTRLAMPPENMAGMANQLHELAFEYRDFDWIQQRIKHTKALSYPRFEELAGQFLSRDNSRRLAVLIEGTQKKQREFRYEITSKEELQSKSAFITVAD